MPTFDDYFKGAPGIYNFARGYSESSFVLLNRYLGMSNAGVSENFDAIPFGAVAASNFAFSLELIFKGLYYVKNNEGKILNQCKPGHDLFCLFTRLDDETQIKIQSRQPLPEYLKYAFITLKDITQIPEDVKYETGSMDELTSNLKLHRSAFEDFRYLFEEGKRKKKVSFNFAFMTNIVANSIMVLSSEIRELQPQDDSLC